MSRFGDCTYADIAAPPAVCFAVVCDTGRTPSWHQAVTAVEILQSGGDGRPTLVSTRIDAILARVEVQLRFTYGHHSLHMTREAGDLKELSVSWTFQDLGDRGTRAHFQTEFDPGRVLSRLARGPVLDRLEALLARQPPEGLRQAIEGASAGPATVALG